MTKKLRWGSAFIVLVSLPLYANVEEKLKDLESPDDSKVIAAAQWLGKEEEKKAVDPLIRLAKSERSPLVRIHAISALGLIKEKGKTTTELRQLIEQENHKTVVYSALVAILNIKDTDNADFRRALEISEQKHQDDPYIRDITQRIRKIISK
ncbi:MAG: HEAT repeat domain-containing protein [Leptospiraceae bacterium]|nr:HEAT repeat domain-containing protein [Leptospiraceae bacterium]MDW8306717.1 HEAT repeat domain-containing protein [Leptospiraceae bacterium]